MILTSCRPTEYLLFLLFNDISRFVPFISELCGIDVTSSAQKIMLLLQYINNNNKGWTLENAPNPLRDLVRLELRDLPTYVIKNSSSSKRRSERTLNGIPFDQAKSAVQKYTRRAVPLKSTYVANDIYLMKWADSNETNGLAGNLTNFYNRIKIIYLEDIGLGSPHLISLIDKTLKSVKDNTTTLSTALPYLMHCMSYVTKTRVYSHIRAHWRQHDAPSPETPRNTAYPLGRDENLREIVDSFIWCLENVNSTQGNRAKVEVGYWLQLILNEKLLKTSHASLQSTSGRPGLLVFEILDKLGFIAPREYCKRYVQICKEWYWNMKTNAEQFLPVYQAVFMYALQSDAVWDNPNPEPHSLDSYYASYSGNLLGEKIEIDNYVIDKHTAMGKTSAYMRNSADFALEGSLVSYDIELYPQFTREYLMGHLQQGKPSSEKAEFKYKARAQLNTGSGRQDVYFASNKLGQDVVVKGPYLTVGTLLMSFKIQNAMKLFPGVNYYDVNAMILYPNMYDDVPLGVRNKVKKGEPYYFLVMEDVMGIKKYPTMTKTSKMWPETEVVDYTSLFTSHPQLGFADPVASKMNDASVFSLVIQLAFRQAFEVGDVCARNFVRVGDKVFNVDTEDIMKSTKVKWGAADEARIEQVRQKNREQYIDILQSWLTPGDSYIDRWVIIERSLTHMSTLKIKKNIEEMIENA